MGMETFLAAVHNASVHREQFIAGPLARVRTTLEGGGYNRLTGGWADVCAESGALILDHLIFTAWNGGGVANPFGVHMATLTPAGAFAMLQRLAMFHGSVFIRNEAHVRLIERVHLNREQFEEKVFAAFEFGDPERTVFASLDRLFDVDEAQYAGALYEAVTTAGYAMEARDFDPAPGLVTERFGQVLRDGYAGFFMPRLAQAIGQKF